jgi:hypothetical protein
MVRQDLRRGAADAAPLLIWSMMRRFSRGDGDEDDESSASGGAGGDCGSVRLQHGNFGAEGGDG